MKVKIMKSVGYDKGKKDEKGNSPVLLKGSVYEVDDETAKKWLAGGYAEATTEVVTKPAASTPEKTTEK